MATETFLQDGRFGARMMRRSPAFTAASVLALALGVGATTTVAACLLPAGRAAMVDPLLGLRAE